MTVPDVGGLVRALAEHGRDVGDVVYESPVGPVTGLDILYGHVGEVAASGGAEAHRSGYSEKRLIAILQEHGFPWVFAGSRNLEIVAYAFKERPAPWAAELLKLPMPE